MKLAIFGNYGVQNLGDDLILEGFLKLHPHDEVVVFCGHPEQVRTQFKLQSQPFFPGGIRSLLKYWFNSEYRQQIKQAQQVLKSCDRVFIGGGGILVDRHFKALYLWRAQLAEIKKSQVPYVFIANSLELNSKRSQRMFKPFLEDARHISVRDKASQDLLARMGLEAELVQDLALSSQSLNYPGSMSLTGAQTTSMAPVRRLEPAMGSTPNPFNPAVRRGGFEAGRGTTQPLCLSETTLQRRDPSHCPPLPSSLPPKLHNIPTVPKVPMVSLALNRWMLDKSRLNILKQFISSLQKKGYQVQFLAFQTHGDDDRAVYKQLDPSISILTGKDQVLPALKSSVLLVGMRFHALLLAIHYGIPTIALPYQSKVIALMTEKGLENQLLPLPDLNLSKLQELFENLVEQKPGDL